LFTPSKTNLRCCGARIDARPPPESAKVPPRRYGPRARRGRRAPRASREGWARSRAARAASSCRGGSFVAPPPLESIAPASAPVTVRARAAVDARLEPRARSEVLRRPEPR